MYSGYSDDSNEFEEYYHYTDRKGAHGIANSGVIRASNDTVVDARYGEGVYLTKKAPNQHSKEELAKNNYDGKPAHWQEMVQNGKVGHYVKVELPKSHVRDMSERGRDVHLYEGDMDLRNYGATVKQNKPPSRKNNFKGMSRDQRQNQGGQYY